MTKSKNNSGFTRRQFLGTGLAVAGGLAAGGLVRPARAASDVVTIYTADGLRDGRPNWYDSVFDLFTEQTGVKVQYVEAGSAGVVNRALRERANKQHDVLVTLPPFIQKAAELDLLAPYKPEADSAIPDDSKDAKGRWYAMVNNYQCFIYNTKYLDEPPATFKTLLEPKFKDKIQYSTPGQAGDGTAFLLQVIHALGGQKAGYAYLKALQKNNVGPSSSTGKLAPLTNKGELWVANGDIQMNFAQKSHNPHIDIFWPANADGERSTLAEPYAVGLAKNAPHPENGKKLVDFLLGKQAQLMVSKIAHGFPARTDIDPKDDNYKQLHKMMEGIEVWNPDWDDVAQNIGTYVKKWRAATA
jgi:2-aminoethylphosphonate transport system substrate-binding protein